MPEFLLRLSEALEPGAARDLVLANLSDEVSAPSHLELFDAFGAFVDATAAPSSPAMSALLAAYDEVAQRGVVSSLAGLLAYESQGAAVADSKGAGLAAHYGAPDEALAFWREHSSIEGDHAEWTFDALNSLIRTPTTSAQPHVSSAKPGGRSSTSANCSPRNALVHIRPKRRPRGASWPHLASR